MPANIIGYELLSYGFREDLLERKIHELMAQGWQPYGKTIIHHWGKGPVDYRCYQAMVLYGEPGERAVYELVDDQTAKDGA